MTPRLVGSEMCIRDRCVCARARAGGIQQLTTAQWNWKQKIVRHGQYVISSTGHNTRQQRVPNKACRHGGGRTKEGQSTTRVQKAGPTHLLLHPILSLKGTDSKAWSRCRFPIFNGNHSCRSLVTVAFLPTAQRRSQPGSRPWTTIDWNNLQQEIVASY